MSITFKVQDWPKTLDLSSRVELDGLSISTSTPGGDDTASISLCDVKPSDYPKLASRVLIGDDDGYFWLGHVAQPEIDLGKSFILNMQGGLHRTQDQRFRAKQVYSQGTDITDVVIHTMSQLCPEISLSMERIVTTGVRLETESEDFDDQTASDVLNAMCSLTNYLVNPITWHVKPSETQPWSQMPILDFFTSPLIPIYTVDTDAIIESGGQVKLGFDLESLCNRVTVTWGNGQKVTVPETISYAAMRIIRDKNVNSEREIHTKNQADLLVNGLLQRFSKLRSVRDTIVIPCDVPVFSLASTGAGKVNPWRVRSGNIIRLLNVGDLGPYSNTDKYIVRSSYDFRTQQLTLQTGELVTFNTLVRLLNTGWASRHDISTGIGRVSNPLPQNDKLPVYGPEFPASGGGSLSAGVPMFEKDEDDEFGVHIHPGLLPKSKETIKINFEFHGGGASPTTGIHGSLDVPASLLKSWEVNMGNASGPVVDSCLIRVHKDFPPSSRLLDIQVSGHSKDEQEIPDGLTVEDDILTFELVTPPTTATWVAVSIAAEKL